MGFKEWLLLEDGFSDAGSDWFYGNILLPSDAFDWAYSQSDPADFKFLQKRWDRERDGGRKFHNIDLDGVLKAKFTAVKSETMPDGDGPGWKHKPDNRPNLTIDTNAKLELRGYGNHSKHINKLTISNRHLDMKDRLNQLFGEFKPNYPTLPDNFDEPWVHKENITPYQVFGPGIRNFTNDKMGIPSRLLGSDETEENKQKQHIKIADFIGKKKKRWKKIEAIPSPVMDDIEKPQERPAVYT
jgi:hypothetical protein